MNAESRPERIGAAMASAGRQVSILARPGSTGDLKHWKACAIVAIERLARSGEPFTAADVTATVGVPCPSMHLLGGMLTGAHRRGRLILVGAVVDVRPSGVVVATRQWIGAAASVETAA